MKKRTPAGDALTELVLETFRLNGAMLEAGNRITEPHGLTSARWQVMGAVHLARQPLTVAQIARRMGLARQGVQRIINDLKRLDMVVLEINMDHKRAPLISLSSEGAKTLNAVDKAQVGWINELSDDLSERQIEQALKVLRIVRKRTERTNTTI